MLTMLFKYILNGCCLEGKGYKAALGGGGMGEKISFSNLRAEFTTYNTGSLITTPKIKIQKHQAIQTSWDLTIWNLLHRCTRKPIFKHEGQCQF
jgi:hypothetical protein